MRLETKFVIACFIAAAVLIMYADIATAYEVPKDAIIKVFDKNGKQVGEMSRKKFKVVKIRPKTSKPTRVVMTVKKEKPKRNSVILHAGPGNTGKLNVGTDGARYYVNSKRGVVLGATYCYTKDNTGVCATGMTNKTFTLGIKKDF